MTERYACDPENAAKIAEWFSNRGGILIWKSINLSNPDASWTSPALGSDGNPFQKPNWQAGNQPDQHITDPAEVDVIVSKEVKRFHVAVRMGRQGLSLKVTDGGTRRIKQAVAKATEKYGKPAWYGFDYGDYNNAVIYVEGERQPLPEYCAQNGIALS